MSRRSSFSESDSDEVLARLLQWGMAACQPVEPVQEKPKPSKPVQEKPKPSKPVRVRQCPGMSLRPSKPVQPQRETPRREPLAQLHVWDDVNDLFDTSREVPMPQPDMLAAYGKWLRSHTVFTSIRRKEKSNQRLTRKERLFKFSSLCALWIIDSLPEFESLPGLFPDVASSDYELMRLYERRWKVFKKGYLALFHFVNFTDVEKDVLAKVHPLAIFASRFEIFLDGYERLQATVPRHGVPELPEDFTF